MERLVRRGYVEVIAGTALLLLGVGLWQLVAVGEVAWLLAAGSWLCAAASIGISKVHVARHPRAADWAWRGLAALAAVAAAVGGVASALVGVLGLAATVGYQTWYSRQHRPKAGLSVGELLPDFPLRRLDGVDISSAELRTSPHVMLFYRGSWCPFCVAQVRSVAAQYRELDRRGVRVALVSPQAADDTRDLAARFDVPMDFYVDEAGVAAELLDIVQSGGVPLAFTGGTNGDTVVPTVVITDDAGRVVWIHHSADHRVRPEPTTFLEVIDRAGVGTR